MRVDKCPGVAAGDLVVAAGEDPAPVGEVEAVLATSKGTQLVLKRAFFPGASVVTHEDRVEASEDDPELGLRWHRLEIGLEDVLRGGRFRRVTGRLTPDPSPSAPPPRVGDARAAESIAQALAQDPLIGDDSGEIGVRVYRGAVSLRGWTRLIGSKVVAEQLARSTPGVWHVRNWLFSDEELRGDVQRWLRTQPGLTPIVRDAQVMLGRVTICLSRPPDGNDRAALKALRDMPGVRGLHLRHEVGD